MTGTRRVTIIGAGVIGLTSGVRLAETGHRVRIVALAGSPDTTSDVAAAVWYPFRTEDSDRALDWALETLAFLQRLAEAKIGGVTVVEGVVLRRVAGAPPRWSGAAGGARVAAPGELPPGFACGHVVRVPVVEMPRHMAWLRARFLAAGGQIDLGVDVTPTGLGALWDTADVVVNCTGLGARELAGDASVVPIRGQIIRVAPGYCSRFYQVTEDDAADGVTYIIPRPDCTVLGGTTEVGVWDTTPDPYTADRIRSRCLAIAPELARAAVLSHAAGLRPGRATVRLERADHPRGPWIHNYGHGGAGVTLGWGSAGAVAGLVDAVPVS